MTMNLRTDQEEAIAKAIESGAYENVDQVIERALEVLRSKDEWFHNIKAEINRKIDRARQFEQRGFYTAEESGVEMERRKATLLADRNR
jgi:Arc/MetJ-type ribon-helix-helix transcriptional regulator